MITIFTGRIGSGKTTALIKWSEQQQAEGILTPVIDGKRMFMNLRTKEFLPMEASGEEDHVQVGKYIFSKKNFEKAITVIRDAMLKPGWLIIDEIGPLELKEEGFHDVLKEVISNREGNTILVVREGVTDAVIKHFALKVNIIDNINKL